MGTGAALVIPAAADVKDREVSGLGVGIDLAAKLFELSQAMADDWEAFGSSVENKARAAVFASPSLAAPREIA